MSKNCIISFANSAGHYADRLARLSNSLRNNFDGDFLAWVGEAALGAELHSINPYSFKIYAFNKAKEAGYKKIMWLDTSVFAVNNVQKIFDDIDRSGFAFQIAGHSVGNYSTDKQLEHFGITRDEAMPMDCIGNAGLLGLDFEKHFPNESFNKWERAMQHGMFKGNWDNDAKTESTDERCKGSRHDLSCSSIIINQMGLISMAYRGDEVLMYGGIFDKVINESIIFKAEGRSFYLSLLKHNL